MGGERGPSRSTPARGPCRSSASRRCEQAVPAEAEDTHRPGLLGSIGDDVLLSFGVPEILLPAVRAIGSSEGLLALGKHLPSEAAEALIWLAEGESPEAVRDTWAASAGGESPPAQIPARGPERSCPAADRRPSRQEVDTTDLARPSSTPTPAAAS